MGRVTERHRAWLEGREKSIEDVEDSLRAVGDILSDYRDPDGRFNSPVEMQIRNLGLTPEDILSLRGKNVLDVGCGNKANLVYWMRELGINAEGLDYPIEQGVPFLMNQGIGSSSPIQRPDGHYDLVVASLFPILQEGLSDFRSLAQRLEGEVTADKIIRATDVVLECLRVVKPQGKFVCWPGLSRVEYLRSAGLSRDYQLASTPLFEGVSEGSGSLDYRTEITKTC